MKEIERMMALLKRPTRLWRVDEAAFLCDCDKASLYGAIRAGNIKQTQQRRIPHSEVVKYLGGYDPFLEFAVAIQVFDGPALDGRAGNFIEKLEELESKIAKLERVIQESQPGAEAA